MASLVAAKVESPQPASERAENKGWTVDTLKIPEIFYSDLFPDEIKQEQLDATLLSTLDKILSPSSPGIIKIIVLPDANIEEERNYINNLNTLSLNVSSAQFSSTLFAV